MPLRFSSIIFTLRNAVLWHLSAMSYGQLPANHQNLDLGVLLKVLLKRKTIPLLTYPGLQVLYCLVFAPLNRIRADVCFILTWKLCSSWEVQGSRISPVRDPRRQEAVSWLLPQTRSTKSRQSSHLPTIKTVPHSNFPWGIKGDLWSVMKNKEEGIVMLLNSPSCFFLFALQHCEGSDSSDWGVADVR